MGWGPSSSGGGGDAPPSPITIVAPLRVHPPQGALDGAKNEREIAAALQPMSSYHALTKMTYSSRPVVDLADDESDDGATIDDAAVVVTDTNELDVKPTTSTTAGSRTVNSVGGGDGGGGGGVGGGHGGSGGGTEHRRVTHPSSVAKRACLNRRQSMKEAMSTFLDAHEAHNHRSRDDETASLASTTSTATTTQSVGVGVVNGVVNGVGVGFGGSHAASGPRSRKSSIIAARKLSGQVS